MTALLWLTRDLRVHDHPALRAALDGHAPSCRCSASTTGCSTGATRRGRARSSCSSAWPTSTARCASAAAARDAARAARARAAGAGPRGERARGALHRRRRSVRAPARSSACGEALREPGVELLRHPGLHAVDDVGALAHRGRAARTRSSRRSIALGSARRGARCSRRAARAAPLPVEASRKGRLPVARGARARAGGRRAAARAASARRASG